jgi:hypothetical protein
MCEDGAFQCCSQIHHSSWFEGLASLVPIHQNKQLVNFSVYTRCLQHQPVVILVISQKLQSSKTNSIIICKKTVKNHAVNLISHVEPNQLAHNKFVTVQVKKQSLHAPPHFVAPTRESTLSDLRHLGPTWCVLIRNQDMVHHVGPASGPMYIWYAQVSLPSKDQYTFKVGPIFDWYAWLLANIY